MTTEKPYAISEVATNEWKEFALYTVQSRAIPNMIDSFKDVQRFYLYSSLVNSKTEFDKVDSVGGQVTKFGYHHGAKSAMAAGQRMAAEWSNNLCVIEGQGSFGSRLIQVAASERYTMTRVHPNFSKYFKDLDLSPVHPDPEHIPPAYYIPVIPILLANGTSGIATGFATIILPRAVRDVLRACQEYIRTGSIKNKLPISFPHFSGTVTYDKEKDRYLCRGVFAEPSKTVLHISEVPYGFDREGYIKVLDKLEERGDIVGYEDLCDKSGFKFDVKLKQNVSANWNNEKIIKEFKLEKIFHENITVIDENGKLKEYDDERDLIKDFCDFRLTILQKRINQQCTLLKESIRWLKIKSDFIQAVLDDKITFKNKTKAQVHDQIMKCVKNTLDDDVDSLLKMNIMSLTKEMVDKLKADVKSESENLKYWETATPSQEFENDLKNI